jgi:hypothetical protein
MASVTGFVIAAPSLAFSARGVLGAPLRFDTLFVVLRLPDTFACFEAVFVARDALFVVLRLRDAFARFEAVFVARDALFATVRPRALPPPTLPRDLDAVDFADLLFAAVLEAVFLEVAVFFFLGIAVFLAAGVPEHALTVRGVHVLGEDQHQPGVANELFQHRPAADEFHRPQIGRAQVQKVEGVEAGRPLAIAP